MLAGSDIDQCMKERNPGSQLVACFPFNVLAMQMQEWVKETCETDTCSCLPGEPVYNNSVAIASQLYCSSSDLDSEVTHCLPEGCSNWAQTWKFLAVSCRILLTAVLSRPAASRGHGELALASCRCRLKLGTPRTAA